MCTKLTLALGPDMKPSSETLTAIEGATYLWLLTRHAGDDASITLYIFTGPWAPSRVLDSRAGLPQRYVDRVEIEFEDGEWQMKRWGGNRELLERALPHLAQLSYTLNQQLPIETGAAASAAA